MLEDRIYTLYKSGISIDEIQRMLGVDDQTYLNALKTIRAIYGFTSEYHDDGRVIYNPHAANKISVHGDSFTAIFYSDLHSGNIKDWISYLELVYGHAETEDIHILFNTGDVIENNYSVPERRLRQKTVEGQIKHLLRHFPFNSSITNFILFGNHDYHALTDQGIDVAARLEEERPDVVSLGYGEANVKVKNSIITLQHNLKNKKPAIPEDADIVFKGHSHKMKIDLRKDIPLINVPALSDALPESYDYPPIPGFLEVTFTFTKDGRIDKVFIKEFNTEKNLRQVSECVLSLRKKIDKNN
jgi:predicted MPP superfamily phosphohydrolase